MNRSHSAPLSSGGPLPPIPSAVHHAESKDGNNRELFFGIESQDAIGDLMSALSAQEAGMEFRKLQSVLASHRVHLENVYLVSGKSRRDFADFANLSIGIEKGPANEIFSIATERFAPEDDKVGHGIDGTMSRAQFSTAVVRLAHLFAMIQGESDGGRVSAQTDDFLHHSK